MKQSSKSLKTMVVASVLAASFGVQATTVVWAAPGDINSVNVGANPAAGQYLNTSGSRTTFQNGSSGITFNGNYRFLESTSTGDLTGNGGSALISTSGMVRLNGSLDASGLMKNGVYTGNGGNITIDAPYFYQNGSIFANGLSGGSVNINVGSMTATAGSNIYAKGFGGNGGSVDIKAAGVVDIQQGVIIDTSGKALAGFDTNIINIQGGLVNVDGVLVANSVASHDPNASAEVGLVWAKDCGPGVSGERAGTIKLAATGTCEDCMEQTVNQAASSGVVTGTEANALIAHNKDLKAKYDGSVVIGVTGIVMANGTQAAAAPTPDPAPGGAVYYKSADGGTITMVAANDVIVNGKVQANGGAGAHGWLPSKGGNGGTITACANDSINVTGSMQANGGDGGNAEGGDAGYVANGANGGHGGQVAFKYSTITHTGSIEAKGGAGGQGTSVTATAINTQVACDNTATATATAQGSNGGKGGNGGAVVFKGPSNPVGSGSINVNGGQGGRGGDATALAAATALYRPACDEVTANASATAVAGEGGAGGESGTVYAPTPSSFSITYTAKAGGAGDAGTATARAVAVSIDHANASASATGNSSSSSSATSAVIEACDSAIYNAQGQIIDALGINNGTVFNKSGSEIASAITSTVSGSSVALATSINNQGSVVTGNASALSALTTRPSGSITTGSNKPVADLSSAPAIACCEVPTPIVQPCDPPPPPKNPPEDPEYSVPPVFPPVFPQPNAVNPGVVLILPPAMQPPVVAFAQPTPDKSDKPQTPTYKEDTPVAAPAVAEDEIKKGKTPVRGFW
jgi:hypothetical protein